MFISVLLPLALGAKLHEAAESNDIAKIKALIESGASIEARGENERTPLHAAAMMGHTDAILALSRAGASTDAQDDGERTPLHMAAQFGRTEAIKVLVALGASVEAQAKGVAFSWTRAEQSTWTPLHIAALQGHTKAIEALIKAGASIEAQDYEGRTPLQLAEGSKVWSASMPEAIKVLQAASSARSNKKEL